MSIVNNLKAMLEKEHITYQVLEHNRTITALETAQAQHIPGRQVIKTVIVESDSKLLMCVLPATHKVDFNKLKKVLNAKEVHLAPESTVAKLFPGYELGAEPPFGSQIPVLIDKILEENDSIVFNAGTHTDMIRIKLRDYLRLVSPKFADIGVHIS